MPAQMPDRHDARLEVKQGVKAIALFEALKGMIVLASGCGLLALLHVDLQQFAEEIVRHFHLNPASGYPRIFLDLADHPGNLHLWQIAGLAFLYSGIRFAEAFGLWMRQNWAQWFSVLSGGVYLPIEVYEIALHASWVKVTAFIVNLVVVWYMARTIMKERSAADQ